ncbi:DUF3857 domain-containing transglutaminase family protein [Candidatus Omnitrophota bacterium]
MEKLPKALNDLKIFAAIFTISIIIFSHFYVFASTVGKQGALSESTPLSTEDVIVLFDDCEVTLKKNWDYTVYQHTRIKLLNDRACKVYSEIPVMINPYIEKVKKIKGYTIKADGKKIPCKRIHEQASGGAFSTYSGSVYKIMSMVGLEPGCEIDYETQIDVKDNSVLKNFHHEFVFSSTVPVKQNTYIVKCPEKVKLNIYSHGNAPEPQISYDKSTHKKVYRWELKDTPAIKWEEFIPPFRDVSTWVGVTTLTSWDAVASWWWNLIKDKIKISPKLKKITKELIKDNTVQEDKANIIFNYVQNKIGYLGIEIGSATYVPFSSTDVLKDMRGDCKGKVMLLLAMLKVAGIEAYPVLISPRSNAIFPDFVCTTSPNHVIAVAIIDDAKYWLDPTQDTIKFGKLHTIFQGSPAIIVRKDKSELVVTPIDSDGDNYIFVETSSEIDEEGSMKGEIVISADGWNAVLIRSIMKAFEKEYEEKVLTNFLNNFIARAKLVKYNFDYLEELDKPIKVNFEFLVDRWAQKTNDYMILSIPEPVEDDNSFMSSERTYPVHFGYTSRFIQKHTIKLPEKYIMEAVPKDYTFENKIGILKVIYSFSEGAFKIKKEESMKLLKVQLRDYPELTKYLDNKRKKNREQFILKK